MTYSDLQFYEGEISDIVNDVLNAVKDNSFALLSFLLFIFVK